MRATPTSDVAHSWRTSRVRGSHVMDFTIRRFFVVPIRDLPYYYCVTISECTIISPIQESVIHNHRHFSIK